MVSGWMKSLQCKSRAFEDVYNPYPKFLLQSASCRKSLQNRKEIVDIPKPKPITTVKPEAPTMNRSRSTVATSSSSRAIIELPVGHSSRNVVDIIFQTSWGHKEFPGRVEMIFKVENGARTISRFEEFREAVKARDGSAVELSEGKNFEENARCVADGNEVMQFHCLGPAEDGGSHGGWSFPERKGSAIRTFSESGCAHENGGGGKGRWAMLVCRVVAGRVLKQLGYLDSLLDKRVEFDSVSADNGELLVFDTRAVLPCFLIIYRL
ncbi:unnamed protein product [Lathyrus oleraceus]|uniref:Uncharacterized protein n=1 Tax=Pisum sativum TaxID=3888 RepID=A0A9D5ASQ0_PEA|nr:uncharacterized protein LOC127135291 [Pisum sativum]KAI5417444.1 hypothetical protein KIW84_042159 [Pisum sativum]